MSREGDGVAGASTLAPAAASKREESRKHILSLMAKKDAMEAEILAIVEELTTSARVGLTEKLVDRDGFPRADVDIHRVLTLRNRKAILDTDLSAVMKEIEQGLAEIHKLTTPEDLARERAQAAASRRPHAPATSGVVAASSASASSKAVSVSPKAFGLVKSVQESSPGARAGLLPGDLVVRFGRITFDQCQEAHGIRPITTQIAEDVPIDVDVLRYATNGGGSELLTLVLTPQRWQGQGLIGAHVVNAPGTGW